MPKPCGHDNRKVVEFDSEASRWVPWWWSAVSGPHPPKGTSITKPMPYRYEIHRIPVKDKPKVDGSASRKQVGSQDAKRDSSSPPTLVHAVHNHRSCGSKWTEDEFKTNLQEVSKPQEGFRTPPPTPASASQKDTADNDTIPVLARSTSVSKPREYTRERPVLQESHIIHNYFAPPQNTSPHPATVMHPWTPRYCFQARAPSPAPIMSTNDELHRPAECPLHSPYCTMLAGSKPVEGCGYCTFQRMSPEPEACCPACVSKSNLSLHPYFLSKSRDSQAAEVEYNTPLGHQTFDYARKHYSLDPLHLNSYPQDPQFTRRNSQHYGSPSNDTLGPYWRRQPINRW